MIDYEETLIMPSGLLEFNHKLDCQMFPYKDVRTVTGSLLDRLTHRCLSWK
jgi:hypothetical protein